MINKQKMKSIWISIVVVIFLTALGVGTYLGLGIYNHQQQQAESSRIEESERARLAEIEERERALLAEMELYLDKNTFYRGIFIDGIDLSDLSLEEARSELADLDQNWRQSFSVKLQLDEESRIFADDDFGLHSDWEEILATAWMIGRSSEAEGSDEQIRDRYAVVSALEQTPVRLYVSRSYNDEIIRDSILEYAKTLDIEPIDAAVAGFEVDARQFIFTEGRSGRVIDGEAAANAVSSLLAEGQTNMELTMESQPVEPELTVKILRPRLGKISESVTTASNNDNRNTNITLINRALNGMVLQPGETFSFNSRIGQRTPERGYLEAGGIFDGVLIDTFGGGICQPNTNLFQAVLMADLQIDERHPHSWPSTYTKPGLDATVSWRGPDFKFTNNTDYPIAIVAWLSKPRVIVQIYGRLFEKGVSIRLDTTVDEITPVTQLPTERFNPELEPGERIELRPEHTGLKVTAYKVWEKDGKVIRREVSFKSTYRPLNKIIEFGPSPTPSPTPAETTPPIEETTIEEITPPPAEC